MEENSYDPRRPRSSLRRRIDVLVRQLGRGAVYATLGIERWHPSPRLRKRLQSVLPALGVSAGIWSLVEAAMADWKRPAHRLSPSMRSSRTVANTAGLAALEMMVLQTILGTRFPLLERVFGFDKTMIAHRVMAYGSVGLVGVHILQKGLQRGWPFLFRFRGGLRAITWGRFAALGMLLIPILALYQKKPGSTGRIPWLVWKIPHYLLYLVVLAALEHAHALGLKTRSLRGVWFSLAVGYWMSSLWRLVDRLRRDIVCICEVVSVDVETNDVTTVSLRPVSRESFFDQRQAGQFGILRRASHIPFMWSDPHPFTVSGGPHESLLRFTIKAMPGGSFSTRVRDWRKGERILVEGPFGTFLPDFTSDHDFVFVAGGVGVTPFLSILRDVHKKFAENPQIQKPRIGFVWGIKSKEDLMLMDEIEEMLHDLPTLRVLLLFSNKGGAADYDAFQQSGSLSKSQHIPIHDRLQYRDGFATIDALREVAPQSNIATNKFYLCGPPIMTEKILASLQMLHVPRSNIHFEYFSW